MTVLGVPSGLEAISPACLEPGILCALQRLHKEQEQRTYGSWLWRWRRRKEAQP